MEKIITKLLIFDFDGTLVDSPLPETGRDIYKTKTGKDFPHKGWWSKRETLDIDIFDIPMIDSVKEDYDSVKDDPEAFKVMLTGRIKPLSRQVETILTKHGLEFDEYHYNTGGPTEIYKMKVMDQLLGEHPSVREIQIWDDRVPHLEIFEGYLKDRIATGRLDKFKITMVPANRH